MRRLALLNGKIFTATSGDPASTSAQAIVVLGNRIEAVGCNEMARQMAGTDHPSESGALTVDLRGKTVLPGFVDSHNHVLSAAELLQGVDCFGIATIDDLKSAVSKKAAEAGPGQWVTGAGWIESQFDERRMPDRRDLDEAAPRNPVALSRLFGVTAVNSMALELSGIRRGQLPPAGRVDLDCSGEPTGILREGASGPVWKAIDSQATGASRDGIERSVVLALTELLRYGTTSVLDPGVNASLMRAYLSLWAKGGLPARVTAMPAHHGIGAIFGREATYPAIEAGLRPGLGDERFRFGNLKMAIDGGLGSKTALMHEPFLDGSRPTVPIRLDFNKLNGYIKEAHENGWGVGIHCCGDLAQDLALSHMADAFRSNLPTPNHRHNIIHGYFPTDYALGVMSDHDIGVSAQPGFIYVEGDIYPDAIDPKRLSTFKPLRTYLKRGIRVAINTDVSSGPYDPLVAIYSAVARKTVRGLDFGQAEALTPREAVAAFSNAGAYLAYREKEVGTIEAGKFADLVVLDRDILDGSHEDILKAKVEATVQDGRFVYLSPASNLSVPEDAKNIKASTTTLRYGQESGPKKATGRVG